MSRNVPQANIAYGVAAGLSGAIGFTAMTLILYFNVTVFPSSNSQNTTSTTTPSPVGPGGDNQGTLAIPAVVAFFSALVALHFALRHARDEITSRQRQFAVASGVVGMSTIADAIAGPITLINLPENVLLGIKIGIILPAFLASYGALVFGALRLHQESLRPEDLSQALLRAGDGSTPQGIVTNDGQAVVRPCGTTAHSARGNASFTWANGGNGSESSMSTLGSARSTASVDTSYAINR